MFIFESFEVSAIDKMLEHLYNNPTLTVTLLISVPAVYLILSYIYERLSIRRLGASPPQVPNYLPFSIDILIRSVRNSLADADLDFWTWLFSHRKNPHSHTVEVDLGRQRFIFTAEPENIKAVLATQFQDYGKGHSFHEDWKDFLGDGIFTTDGDLWHASRQLIRPQFVKERVKDLDIFENHVQKVIKQLGGRGEEVDIAALFYRFTLDSATEYLLGESVGSLDSPQAEFAEAFNEVQRVQNAISRTGPFGKLVPKRTFWEGLKVINSFVEPFIEQVLRMNIHDLKDISNKSFLQAIAVSGVRDRKVIRDQVVNILLAGRDTTAGALSFLFLELARRSDIVFKLRREILETVGSQARPTYENLKDMAYLQHTLNEVLRLYPSVPFNVSIPCFAAEKVVMLCRCNDGLVPGLWIASHCHLPVLKIKWFPDLFLNPSLTVLSLLIDDSPGTLVSS